MATWLIHTLIFISGGFGFMFLFFILITIIADKLQMDGEDK